MFNALKYTKLMEEAGFSRGQAETAVNIMMEIMEQNLATKQDILDLRTELESLSLKMTIKIGAIQAASIAIIVALIKLL